MLHIGKYFGYVSHGAIKVLFYPHQAKKYIKNKDNFPLLERYDFVRSKIKEVFEKIIRVEFDVKGLEKLNKEDTYLFTPNHQSMLDPLSLLYFLEDPCIVVSKKEVQKFPVIGKIVYSIDAIFLDRDSPRDALNMVHHCNKELLEKKNVIIFPEGTRSKKDDVSIIGYKPGAFKCVYGTGAKIVPVVIDNSYLFLSTKKKSKNQKFKIRFLDPISKEEYEGLSTNELADLIQKRAEKELANLRINN